MRDEMDTLCFLEPLRAPCLKSRTHSLVYKMNCLRERGKQQAPDVLNNSCAINTALSNNNGTAPRSVRQTYTVHTVWTKIKTRVDSTGKDSGHTKAQLTTSRVVSPCTVAAFDAACLANLGLWPVDCVPLTVSCCGTLSVSPICAHWVHAIDLSCTLFDFLFRALDCASALGRIRRLQALHLLMAGRQTSIVLTSTPPAPALPHELRSNQPYLLLPFSCLSLVPSDTHPWTRRCSRWSFAPRLQLARLPRLSQGQSRTRSPQLDITSLPRAFVSRLFKFSFTSDAFCSRDTQAENSLPHDAEFAAAGPAFKTDLLTSSLSRIVSASSISISSAFDPLYSILGLAARLTRTLRTFFHYCFLAALDFHLINERLGGRFAASLEQHFTQTTRVNTYSHTIDCMRLCVFITHSTMSFHFMGSLKQHQHRGRVLIHTTYGNSAILGYRRPRPLTHELHQLRNTVRMTSCSSFSLSVVRTEPRHSLVCLAPSISTFPLSICILGLDSCSLVGQQAAHTCFWSRDSMNPRWSPNNSSVTLANSPSRTNSSLRSSHTPWFLAVNCPSAMTNTATHLTPSLPPTAWAPPLMLRNLEPTGTSSDGSI